MPLASGTRIGVYEVLGLVGAGGMGEVYRARDTRLDRPAALKTLPDEFARDPERLARFEREARTLAQLNHPHIASIYGLEGGASPALVMEMVEGQTLAERITTGPLPLEEVLAIAKQIAEALEHAHGLGIVHRDLKPANVKVGARESAPNVKVLDFGLAKAMLSDAPGGSSAGVVSSPTITSPANMTRAGVILGTAAYMAPEQARGKPVDQRADIWAFGCVLFEMLSRRRTFPGDETADVLAKVIQSDPDWKLIPASTPHALVTVLHRCLRKDPARRIHSIADVGIDLDDIGAPAPDHAAAAPALPRRWWRAALAGAAIGAALTAAAMLVFAPARMPPVPDAVLRYAMALPDEWTLYRSVNNGRLAFAISPDGQKLAVVATDKAGARRVLVRRLDETEFRELPGTDGSQGVFWAPDSHRLGFVVPGGVRRADLSGAGSQSMVTGSGLAGASWNGRDEILASLGEPNLVRWPAAGGSPQPFAETPGNRTARLQPSWLPDDSFMFLDVHSPRLVSVMIQSTDKAAHTIAQIEPEGAGTVTAFYASNHLVVGRTELGGRSLLTAQRFDLASRRLSGEPVSLAADVNPTFSVSSNGVLVYGRGRFSIERLMWLDAKGSIISTAGERLQMANFDLSSDERSVVMQGIGTGLQSHDLIRGVTTQLNPAGVDPVWSPDGKQIAFSIVGPPNQGVYVMPAFGGTPRRVYEFPMSAQTYIDGWSNDGKWLAGHVGASTGSGILIPLAAGAKPILFEEKSEGGAGIDEGRFSPDGRWLAYGINAQAGSDVYVIPLPPTGERWKVSVAGGAQPRWRADGRALYYLSLSGTMMMVDVVGKAGAPVSAPRAVFETGLQVQPAYDQYAVNRDGTRFLVRRPDDVGRLMQNQVYVIINWPALLKGAP